MASHIVTELLKTGKHTITAISRQESKATFPTGVNVARVDYTSEDSLVSALRGHDFLIITLTNPVPPELHPSIVKAAVKAGVPYIMPNVYGYDILNEQFMNESIYGPPSKKALDDVANSGANYVVLCCGFWYEWSLSGGEPFYGFDIKEHKATFFDEGKVKINTSTLSKCGKAVANLLSLPVTKEGDGKPALEDWKNKPLYVSSFLVSQRDMLDSINRAMGTTDKDWTVNYEKSDERTKTALADMQKGEFTGFARALYTQVFFPNGNGDFERNRTLANDVLGLDKEDLDKTTKWVVEKKLAGEMVYDRWG